MHSGKHIVFKRMFSVVRELILLRHITYQKENQFLSEFACFSEKTLGRDRPEEPCPMRTDFQRDRDRIIHSKSFRRLKNKTQVFLSPEGDHYRTRLTHTLDVSQISRSIARALRLNEDLAEAIALGHDLGHTPFGHAGERTLQRIAQCGFEHNEQSLRLVEVLENDGKGLNLTKEVRDGILNHRTALSPATLEGQVVRIADKIAYINHDIDDAQRAGLIKPEDLPADIISVLGNSSRARINNMIISIYNYSNGKNIVDMEQRFKDATSAVRQFMFKNVYIDSAAKTEEEKADRMIELLYGYYLNNTDKLPPFYLSLTDKYSVPRAVCDYISSMSDKYAVYSFKKVFIPSSWRLD